MDYTLRVPPSYTQKGEEGFVTFHNTGEPVTTLEIILKSNLTLGHDPRVEVRKEVTLQL